MLLVLPVLIVLFSALAFYAMGGGRGDTERQTTASGKGINTQLPGAQLKKDQGRDKMALYDQAQRDSASAKSRSSAGAFAALGWDTTGHQIAGKAPGNTAQDNETKIKERLAQINKQISQPPPVTQLPVNEHSQAPQSADLERMEKLLKQTQQSSEPDPEMQQLNTMLDKIIQIQNPPLVKDKQQMNKPALKDSAFKAIPAMIDGNQKVKPGGVVKLRLRDTININGIVFPKDQSLSGLCAVTNQRLLLDIKNIRLGTTIIPVNLTVFSLDGLQGINAPEAELGEAVGSGAGSAMDNMQFLSMDQSLGTQAATAGISAAKGLLGKKVKKIRVKLKGGETVLLRINH